jgi:hypothetical protein
MNFIIKDTNGEMGAKTLKKGGYWNGSNYATAIVAVIIEGIDWFACIGGAPVQINEQAALNFVARTGCKISEELARFIFPDIELPYKD